MDNIQAHAEPYVRLSGLQFRQTKIECPHCSWAGTAGNLKVMDLAAFCETPSYACPNCMKTVATHDGLSSDEVMEEMQKVQSILAQEYSPTCINTEQASKAQEIDYSAVRSQIHFPQADKQQMEEGDQATALESHESSDLLNTKILEPA